MSENKIKIQKSVSNTESGILAKLWRNILEETGMVNSLDYMVKRYVNESNSIKSGKRKTKSSLINDITAPAMTFKTFMDLLLNFVKVRKVELVVKLHYANGDTSVHSVAVAGNTVGEEREEGKEDVK